MAAFHIPVVDNQYETARQEQLHNLTFTAPVTVYAWPCTIPFLNTVFLICKRVKIQLISLCHTAREWSLTPRTGMGERDSVLISALSEMYQLQRNVTAAMSCSGNITKAHVFPQLKIFNGTELVQLQHDVDWAARRMRASTSHCSPMLCTWPEGFVFHQLAIAKLSVLTNQTIQKQWNVPCSFPWHAV